MNPMFWFNSSVLKVNIGTQSLIIPLILSVEKDFKRFFKKIFTHGTKHSHGGRERSFFLLFFFFANPLCVVHEVSKTKQIQVEGLFTTTESTSSATKCSHMCRTKYSQPFFAFLSLLKILGNYYGTPKPPAEPSPVQPDLVDQVLFDEEFDTEVQRKRTTSVSKMDRKDSTAPEDEDEEERSPMVNGLTGERLVFSFFFYLS